MKCSTSTLVLVLALTLAGCGGVDPGSADRDAADRPEPDEPVPSGDGGPADPTPDADSAQLALPEARHIRHGARDTRPRPFERAVSDETDDSLHVIYHSGVEPCAVLGDVEIEASAERVTVTLLEGHLPDDDGEAPVCIEIAEEVSVRIPLDAPLDDRTLVDGATDDTVPVDIIRMSDAAAS